MATSALSQAVHADPGVSVIAIVARVGVAPGLDLATPAEREHVLVSNSADDLTTAATFPAARR